MQEIFLKDKIMSNLNSQEKLYNYNLVDYGKKVPLALITKDSQVNCNEKVFQFTEDEAYKLNYAFAINRSDKRYVRAD